MYVVDLVARGVVNTMPEATLDAVADHGVITRRHDPRRVRVGGRDDARRWPTSASTCDDVVAGARGRGRREVRDVVERPARVDQGASWSGSAKADSQVSVERPHRQRRPDGGSDLTGAGQPAGRARTPRSVGPGRRGRGRPAARLARPAGDLRGAAPPAARAAGAADRARPRPRRAGRHGRLVAGAGGHHPHAPGADLTILDSTDPHQVGAALADRIDRTVLVVASKSGGTVETDSHRRAYEQAFRDAGLTDAELAERIVVVTDPGSPLHDDGRQGGLRRGAGRPERRRPLQRPVRVRADAEPAGRCRRGAAARRRAGARRPTCGDDDNPGIAAGPGAGRRAPRPAATSWCWPTPAPASSASATGPSSWSPSRPASRAPASCRSSSRASTHPGSPTPARTRTGSCSAPGRPGLDAAAVSGSLGAQFLLWEYATAVAGKILGINPFDQPNVAESKENTAKILDEAGDGPLPEGEPALVDGAVEVHGDLAALGSPTDLAGVLPACVGAVARRRLPGRDGLPRPARRRRRRRAAAAAGPAASAAPGRPSAGRRGSCTRPASSTRAARRSGVFLQITGAVSRDVDVPGRPYTFGRLQMAQALGDLRALDRAGDAPSYACTSPTVPRASRQLLAAAEATG